MAFYKKQGNELLTGPNFVLGADFELYAVDHETYTYPVSGWYWFDTLDAAMEFYTNQTTWQRVSPRQIRQAFSQMGIRATIEGAIANASQDVKDWYEFSTFFDRNNPVSISIATSLGFTTEQMDAVWQLASTL